MLQRAQRTPGRYYNLFWRWHFYAGLCVAPFLIVLSLTGSVYLFNDEINDILYPELRFTSGIGESRPPSTMIAAAERAYPGGKVTRIYMPTAADRSAELFLSDATGGSLRVFVDPASAAVLGAYTYANTLIGLSDQLHGSLLLGDFGDAIVELAACWTLVMIVTGFYLWFPRKENAGAWWPRLHLRGRSWWKDIHKVTGLYTAALIVFLIITGLPWATVWGDKVLNPIINAAGLGYPDGTRRPLGAPRDARHHDLPWTLQQAQFPVSDSTDATSPLPVDRVADIIATNGMKAYRLFLPQTADDIYMAYTYPNQPEGQRTLHIDQYSGELLGDVRFQDYGFAAKLVEWGVALHMGNYFGRANQIVMLIPCIASIALVVSGVVMWWKRKPKKGFGAPPASRRGTLSSGPMLTAGALMLCFPLFGASVLLILLGEKMTTWIRSRFSTA